MIQSPDDSVAHARTVAQRFVAARRAATPLVGYPGTLPPDIDSAYRCQDEAIAL